MPSPSTASYVLVDHDMTHADVSGKGGTSYVLRLRDMDMGDKPRERLMKLGPGELSMTELVAILLNVGTRREEVLAMARRILKEYGERAILNETDPSRLSMALNIPLTKACQLVAGLELGRRFYQTRAGRPVVIRTATQAFIHFSGMADMQKEQLRALYLGSRYQLLREEVVSVGSLTANIVHPREIFQPAIVYGAVAIIIAHNHPSGSLEPTESDLEVTRQLVDAGKLLGIELLDHLIIAGEAYASMMEQET